MRPRLLALDLDGTLLRPGGGIDARDEAAVQRAIHDGVTVTIATGRVSTGTLPTARTLGLQSPLVCADGGLLVCGRTGDRLEQLAIALPVAEMALQTVVSHALSPFVLMHDRIHCDESGRDYAEYVSVWTRDLHVHSKLSDVHDWRLDGEIAFAAGIGTREGVEGAHKALERDHPGELEIVSFQIRRSTVERWALLARPHGCNKGAALARLAERLGVAQADVAAVGDWYNDVTMLKWAGRSFAMGQAPEVVASMATDRLKATAITGGGVAEAIDLWLSAST